MLLVKSYHQMLQYEDFTERFEYLKLRGNIGEMTFGSHRYVNQNFYTSKRWQSVRSQVIIRDNGCDMACENYPIGGIIHIHHINPVTLEMFENDDPCLYDLNNLVCVSSQVHRAIHYGTSVMELQDYVPRKPGDTKLW